VFVRRRHDTTNRSLNARPKAVWTGPTILDAATKQPIPDFFQTSFTLCCHLHLLLLHSFGLRLAAFAGICFGSPTFAFNGTDSIPDSAASFGALIVTALLPSPACFGLPLTAFAGICFGLLTFAFHGTDSIPSSAALLGALIVATLLPSPAHSGLPLTTFSGACFGLLPPPASSALPLATFAGPCFAHQLLLSMALTPFPILLLPLEH